MARQRRQRRQKGVGSITLRGANYYLTVKVGQRAVMRVITDSSGDRCTSIEAARAHAPALAERIRDELTRNIEGTGLDTLPDVYRQDLPTYAKRKGAPHPESTGKIPIAPRTLTANLRYIGAFVQYMGRQSPQTRTVQAVERQHAAGFMATMGDLLPSSYNRALMAMRHVWNVLPIDGNPFAALPQKSKTEVTRKGTSKVAFTPDQLQTMQERASGWIRPAMAIGFHTALRLGDVVTLKWTEVDAEGYIRRTQRKTGKEEVIYAPEVLAAMTAWRHELGERGADEHIFPDQAAAYLGIRRKIGRAHV